MRELDSEKEDKILFHSSGGRFLIPGLDCLLKCSHNDSEVVGPGRTPGFFIIFTGRKGSRLWAYPRPHAFLYYPEKVKRTITSTFCMEKVIVPPPSVFVGHGYL